MANKIKGTIVKVLPLESGVSQRTGKPWSRQEYILEYRQGDYIKNLAVSALGDNIARLALREGLECTLLISVSSQEWNGRWYTRVEAFGREDLQADNSWGQAQQAAQYGQPTQTNQSMGTGQVTGMQYHIAQPQAAQGAPMAQQPQAATQQPTQHDNDLPF